MSYECDSCYQTPCLCQFVTAIQEINTEIEILKEKVKILEDKEKVDDG